MRNEDIWRLRAERLHRQLKWYRMAALLGWLAAVAAMWVALMDGMGALG